MVLLRVNLTYNFRLAGLGMNRANIFEAGAAVSGLECGAVTLVKRSGA